MNHLFQCRSYRKKNFTIMYSTVIVAATKCKPYREITVEIGTQLKTVKITLNIFAVQIKINKLQSELSRMQMKQASLCFTSKVFPLSQRSLHSIVFSRHNKGTYIIKGSYFIAQLGKVKERQATKDTDSIIKPRAQGDFICASLSWLSVTRSSSQCC